MAETPTPEVPDRISQDWEDVYIPWRASDQYGNSVTLYKGPFPRRPPWERAEIQNRAYEAFRWEYDRKIANLRWGVGLLFFWMAVIIVLLFVGAK